MERASHPSKLRPLPQPINTAIRYMLLKPAEYYQINLAIHRGLQFTRSDRVMFEIFIDGKQRDGIIAKRSSLNGDRDLWSAVVHGVSLAGSGKHAHHRFQCKYKSKF